MLDFIIIIVIGFFLNCISRKRTKTTRRTTAVTIRSRRKPTSLGRPRENRRPRPRQPRRRTKTNRTQTTGRRCTIKTGRTTCLINYTVKQYTFYCRFRIIVFYRRKSAANIVCF